MMHVYEKQQIYQEYRIIAARYVKEMLVTIAKSVISKCHFTLLLKNHTTERYATHPNQNRTYKLSTNSKKTCKSVEMHITLLSEINRLLILNEHATKRDIYYRHQDIFKNQIKLDHILDHIACTFAIPRDALNIHASAKGLVHGDVRIQLATSLVDCSNGVLIPRDDLVMSIRFEGRFVLVIEKDAVFHTIAADYHHLRDVFGPFALITVPTNSYFWQGKGYPDLATTLFLKNFDASIPIFVLVDFDPHGIEIYLKYLRHASCHLLGMSFHDIDNFNEMSHQRIPTTVIDNRKIKSMLKRSNLPHNVCIELMRMNTNGFKAELEIMSESIEPHFFTRTYLTTKLKQGLNLSSSSQSSTRISQ